MATIREYTIGLLEKTGCSLNAYKNVTVDQAVADVLSYEEENGPCDFPAEDVGKELVLICNNERLESLPPPRSMGDDFDDWGSWGIGDFYDKPEALLKEALASGERFDTGWHGYKKELETMRIQRAEDKTIVSVHAYHDEWSHGDSLFYDALPEGEEGKVTDDMIEEIRGSLYDMMPDSNDEFDLEEDLPDDASFDDIISKAKELIAGCNQSLEEAFHMCISQTYYVLYYGHEHRSMDEVNNMIQERIRELS